MSQCFHGVDDNIRRVFKIGAFDVSVCAQEPCHGSRQLMLRVEEKAVDVVRKRGFFQENVLEARTLAMYTKHPYDVVLQGFVQRMTLGQHVAHPFPHLTLGLLDVPLQQSHRQGFFAWEVLVESSD